MSDYLGHLVARSLAPKAGIQPRLPSLFEPLPGSTSSDRVVDFERKVEAQTAPTVPASNETPVLPKPVEHPSSNGSPLANLQISTGALPPPVSAPDHSRDVRTDSDSPPLEPVSPASAERRTPTETRSVPMAFRQATPPPVVVEENSVSAPPRQNGKIEPVVRSKSRPEEASRGPDKRETAPQNVPAPPAPASSRRNSDSAQPGIVIRSVQTISKKAPILPVNAARSSASVNPAISSPAPVPNIQVTIGRLEVRASSPEAAMPRARAKKEPAMSLETYLQRRTERGA